jgi:hypothetical protein
MDDFHRNNKSITENFYDNYLGQEILTDHFPTKYTKETEESVSIECKLKDVQDYYKEVKKPFKKRVKNLKHKYK